MVESLSDDAGKLAKSAGVNGVPGTLPLSPKAHQIGFDQNLEVLRNRRLRQSDLPDKILDAAAVNRSQIPEQP